MTDLARTYSAAVVLLQDLIIHGEPEQLRAMAARIRRSSASHGAQAAAGNDPHGSHARLSAASAALVIELLNAADSADAIQAGHEVAA